VSEVVAVIGSGQMGLGIAQVAASHAKRQVLVYDISQPALMAAKDKISASLNKLEEKGKLNKGEAKASMERISFHHVLDELKSASFIIEAIVEREAVKKELFVNLDGISRASTIFASNTSSISITSISSATKRPDRFIGMHFMNPVPIMTLTELIRSPMTSDATYLTTKKLAEEMGKTTVLSKDFPGFIVNRILMPMINEAFFTLYEGLANAEDIDTAMKLGTNQPMGPLALADFIGLDTCLYIMGVMHENFGDPKFRPCPLLKQFVNAGLLGKKSGRGVFTYER
jgi:3-hydroxybutyryl-CoA dehydrogenase